MRLPIQDALFDQWHQVLFAIVHLPDVVVGAVPREEGIPPALHPERAERGVHFKLQRDIQAAVLLPEKATERARKFPVVRGLVSVEARARLAPMDAVNAVLEQHVLALLDDEADILVAGLPIVEPGLSRKDIVRREGCGRALQPQVHAPTDWLVRADDDGLLAPPARPVAHRELVADGVLPGEAAVWRDVHEDFLALALAGAGVQEKLALHLAPQDRLRVRQDAVLRGVRAQLADSEEPRVGQV
mmetsp:Transcript_151826/g.485269  ORF Transcript_151826/g.485269 Transcript_151826/m.485269 type:complete len:244 (+) Transcript_151826:4775-5506(+)